MDVSTLEENGEKMFHLPHKPLLDIPVIQSTSGNTEAPFFDTSPHNSDIISSTYFVPLITQIPISTTLSMDAVTSALQRPHLTSMISFESVPFTVGSPEISATMATLALRSLAPSPSQHTEKPSSTPLSTSSTTPIPNLGLRCTLYLNQSTGHYDLSAIWTIPAGYVGRILTFFCEFSVQPFPLLRTDRIFTEVQTYNDIFTPNEC